MPQGPNGFSYPGPYDTPSANGPVSQSAQFDAIHQNEGRYSGKPRRPDNFISAQKDMFSERNVYGGEDVTTNFSDKSPVSTYFSSTTFTFYSLGETGPYFYTAHCRS